MTQQEINTHYAKISVNEIFNELTAFKQNPLLYDQEKIKMLLLHLKERELSDLEKYALDKIAIDIVKTESIVSVQNKIEKEDKIKCPKCGSEQITAGKKGFSGKKAVVGAVVTGGIGLLAGTIGSNDVILYCMKCGNKFKPNEAQSSNDAPLTKAEEDTGAIVSIIIFAIILIIILKACL